MTSLKFFEKKFKNNVPSGVNVEFFKCLSSGVEKYHK